LQYFHHAAALLANFRFFSFQRAEMLTPLALELHKRRTGLT